MKWIKEAEQFEFCKSYGITNIPAMNFLERQEDFYISLLSILHDMLEQYYVQVGKDDKLKKDLLHIVKGLLVYSQRETSDAFHGVRRINNQLYVASIYYLCDYPAISSWVMGNIQMDEYEEESGQLLAYIISGGRAVTKPDVRESFIIVFKDIEAFIFNGDNEPLGRVVSYYNEKYDRRDFCSSTDFYMTAVLRCVLKQFSQKNIWQTLKAKDPLFDWKPYVIHSYKQHILSFLPSQQDAIDKGLLDFKGAFSLKMPTSAGKSYITELLIFHELRSNPDARVLYLAPLRALSRELRDRFRKIHKELGFTYATKYGGSVTSISEDNIDEAQLLIATPESFMAIESAGQEVIDSFTLVICDEGQLLDDYTRGINYELLLSRLRKSEKVRFLFISAIIPNIDVINRWLKGSDDHIGNSAYRPSRLVLAEALVGDESAELYVYNNFAKEINFTVPNFIDKNETLDNNLRYYDEKREKWIVSGNPVGCTLALKAMKAGPVLLFATGKKIGLSCTGLTKHLIGMLDKGTFDAPIKYAEEKILEEIQQYVSYELGCNHLLYDALVHAFAFHHGDIPQNIREKIERGFDKGIFRLIISNTTLAEGVNLPIKTMVLANALDPSAQGMFLSNTRLKNIIGRVGRAGRVRYGTIIVPVASINGMLIKLLKEALDHDDSKLDKMKGTLYDLVEHFIKDDDISNEANIEKLLAERTFSDAIDEMIIRNSEEGLEDTNLEVIVKESLAYSLSDETKRKALNSIFELRFDALKKNYEGCRYYIMKATGLNMRELEVAEKYFDKENLKVVENVDKEDDGEFVSVIIDGVMSLPTVEDSLNSEGKQKQKLLQDVERLKRVTLLWMQGRQYHEIASEEKFSVDDAIQIVMYLQGKIHDKADCLLAYLRETHGLDNEVALIWPEYLRIGINSRLMYELHRLRIPERIQLHALQKYYDREEMDYDNYKLLASSLIKEKENIEKYMYEHNYPALAIKDLMVMIHHLENKELE